MDPHRCILLECHGNTFPGSRRDVQGHSSCSWQKPLTWCVFPSLFCLCPSPDVGGPGVQGGRQQQGGSGVGRQLHHRGPTAGESLRPS